MLGLFALVQLTASLATAALLRRWSGGGGEPDLAFVVRIALPVVLACSHTAGWLGVWWLVTRRHRQPFLAALGLAPRPEPRALVRALLAGMALQVAVVLLATLAPPPPDFRSPIELFLKAGSWALAVLFVAAILLAPLLEEVLFRGLLLPTLRKRLAFIPAALVVSVLFAAAHTAQTGTYWPALLGIGLCGFALAWLRERSRTLWPAIAFHAGFNLTAFLPLLALGGRA
ncbi:MAG: CPBP family intramembrane metalloprotease [Candidatus Lambdaproteobacteria bacterium]|nr:CPBP family intramembrane metalloprotease [Candidatus Lambdaproteobacteria bacterium]